jgi:hypothetical protein
MGFVTRILLPAAAAAQRTATLAPPGNSAVTEYLETVPNAMGASPPRSGAPQSGVLRPDRRRALERLGADGRALAAVVDATSPPSAGGTAGTAGRGRGAPANASQGAAPVSQAALAGKGAPSRLVSLLTAATGQDGGGGLGALLPVLMAASLLGMIARAVRRRRA